MIDKLSAGLSEREANDAYQAYVSMPVRGLFHNLMDKFYLNVDDRSNGNMLRIITRETKSKFQLPIGVFAIAFVTPVIEKCKEFRNTLTMKYEL